MLPETVRVTPRSVRTIQQVAEDHYGVSHLDLLSERRARAVAWPRQVAMYMARKLTPHSLPKIGRLFNRDHTTVLHAIAAVERRMYAEPGYAHEIELLLERAAAEINRAVLETPITREQALQTVLARIDRGHAKLRAEAGRDPFRVLRAIQGLET